MDTSPSSQPKGGVPTYLGNGARAGRFTDYYPAWMDKLADDVTVEGSLFDGAAQGAEAVRAIARAPSARLYEQQKFNFAGPCGDNGFVEDYTAPSAASPSALSSRHERRGQAQHIAANYRPRSSVAVPVPAAGQGSREPPTPSTSSPASPDHDGPAGPPAARAPTAWRAA